MGVSFVKNHIYVLSCIWGTDGGVICQKSHVLSCIVGTDGWGHSSLGCVICKKKSHSCIIRELTFVWFQLKVSPVTLMTCSDNTTGDSHERTPQNHQTIQCDIFQPVKISLDWWWDKSFQQNKTVKVFNI